MVEQDTVRLLRECDAGIRMGVASIDDVLEHVASTDFKKRLLDCKHAHEALGMELESLLSEYGDEGKSPNPIAKGMSWIKTNVKLGMNESDQTVASLMTDGCDMGVKSLSRFLNECKDADERAKDICRRLIDLEEGLGEDIRSYL